MARVRSLLDPVWIFDVETYSSSESYEGGILPTVDSSSSESSGYADALGNSLGLECI